MATEGLSAQFLCNVSGYTYGFGVWMTPTACDWYGVACKDGHVVALCLVKNSLNGTLVGLALPYLRHLTIVFAPLLTGEVPASYATTLPLIAFMLDVAFLAAKHLPA